MHWFVGSGVKLITLFITWPEYNRACVSLVPPDVGCFLPFSGVIRSHSALESLCIINDSGVRVLDNIQTVFIPLVHEYIL